MGYIEDALRTESKTVCIKDYPLNSRLLHAALGMVTEAGEFADAIKKNLFYGKDVDLTNLIEELGDMFWYIAIACDALEVSFEEVQRINIEKLKKRYPKKFTQDKAINRDLEAERKVLENK